MVKTIVSVGSSIISGSSGSRIREVGDAFADLNSLDSRNRDDVARGNFFGFVAFEAAERKKLGDFRGLNRAVEFRDSDFGAALQSSLKNAGDGDAPEKIAVIEIRHLNLQHAAGSPAGGGIEVTICSKSG